MNVTGRDLCPCVRADGARLLPPLPSCPTCGGEGGVGRAEPTEEEAEELRRAGWVLARPELGGGWVHEFYGAGRWRTALHLARDDARRAGTKGQAA